MTADGGATGAVKVMARYLLLVMLAFSMDASARMYQWLNPGSGKVQLSGEPPAWYRSPEGGPRVWVYDNGRLVDDTSIQLPEAHSEELRETAFRLHNERQQSESLKRLQQAARRAAARRDRAERREESEAEAVQQAKGAAEAALEEPGELDSGTIESLKSIVNQWDALFATGVPAPK